MEYCIADGCRKCAEKGRKYCHGHRKRERQQRPMDAPLREWGAAPADYLEAKALELANAKDDGEHAYRLARKRLRFAAIEYARQCQKVPRPPETK